LEPRLERSAAELKAAVEEYADLVVVATKGHEVRGFVPQQRPRLDAGD